jgi:hypothetical protein
MISVRIRARVRVNGTAGNDIGAIIVDIMCFN